MTKTTLEHCTVEREGHVTIVTINRPDAMNSLHYAADIELSGVWDDFESDPDQWIGILTGAGDKAFSAGNDVKAHAASGTRRVMPRSGFGGFSTRFDISKPVIAAVNGFAVGGGFELALASDIVIADEARAWFAFTEPRFGLAPLAGGAQYLPRFIGMQRAMGILLTGRRVPAQEGYDLGFVTAVAPEGKTLEVAREWAEMMMQSAPASLRATKQTVRRTMFDGEFVKSFPIDMPEVEAMRNSPDYLEGVLAFAEKRPPVWSGG
ncbi:enoyl-CoA hydratase-related protein [Nitratireductor alexandrii]|uniref:enoyl-CoA hydratase-related protein n=1 Tax=Nitratireductor alexandrii TaxID=2448161 RepID=UPI000FD70FE5|nr:enoyl-CoA hydratase-related protein [Nitratireductor alexandrii]